jgi:hypothetical protein
MATTIAADYLDAANEAVLADADTISLHTGDPGVDGAANELDGGGYERQPIAFDASSGGVKASSIDAVFTSDGDDWDEVTHYALWVDGETPTFVGATALAAPIDIDGDETTTITLATGDVTLTAEGAG